MKPAKAWTTRLGELARDEIAELEPQLEQVNLQLEEALLPRDEDADRNVIMEIRGGAGGEKRRCGRATSIACTTASPSGAAGN